LEADVSRQENGLIFKGRNVLDNGYFDPCRYDHYVDIAPLPTIKETSPTPLRRPKIPRVVSKFLWCAVCLAQTLPYAHYEYGS